MPVAVANLRSLSFVGLTEEWDASVVLFHAKFLNGSAPAPAELHNMRPGTAGDAYDPFRAGDAGVGDAAAQPAHLYDAGVLEGWWDDADERVYAEARSRFQRDFAVALSHPTRPGRRRR